MQIPLTAREHYTTVVICFVNLCVYMHRFTVIRLSDKLIKNYDTEKSFGHQLNLAFLVPFILVSPLFGYLGDRYCRRKIMITSVLLWSMCAFVSAIAPTGLFFLCTQVCVGVFQAGFCTVAPSVLADIARGDVLSKELSHYYMAMPVGLGMGHLVITMFSNIIGQWWLGLFFDAILTFTNAIFLFFGLSPKRGFKDTLEFGTGEILKATSYKKDLLSLTQNISFILQSLALSCIFFATGAITIYGSELLVLGYELIQIESEFKQIAPAIAVKFGAITMVTGFLGVQLGSKLSRLFRAEIPCVDTIICGWAAIVFVPIIAIAMLTASTRTWETFYYIFFGELAVNSIWAVSADMLLYIVPPTRRCSVIGWNTLISHAFGDLLSKTFVVKIRNVFYEGDFTELLEIYDIPDLDIKKFYTLQKTLHVVLCIELVGGILFLCNAFFIVKSIKKAKAETLSIAKPTKLPKMDI